MSDDLSLYACVGDAPNIGIHTHNDLDFIRCFGDVGSSPVEDSVVDGIRCYLATVLSLPQEILMKDHVVAIDENENERVGVLSQVSLSECYAVWSSVVLSGAHWTYQKILQMIDAVLQPCHTLQCCL